MKPDLFSLDGKTAVVLGATGVLGGVMAEALAAGCAAVAVCGRSRERGEACAERIRAANGTAQFIEADVMDAAGLRAAHEKITSTFGSVDVLVNAAGGNDPAATVTAERPVEAITIDAWRANFDMNLVGGVLLPCQEFGPAMVRRGSGSIINIASVSAHLPLSRVIAYSAAKAAVLSLTQFLAREWARAGVRVNSITPGFFPAEQNRRLLFNDDGSPTARAASILGHTPMGRFGNPTELAGAVRFLAAEAASGFVTGTDIRVDGGFLSQTI
jgi:NAD(P)-dependent dehydrogenase (short-subunit alcohol dehydrogenase family)